MDTCFYVASQLLLADASYSQLHMCALISDYSGRVSSWSSPQQNFASRAARRLFCQIVREARRKTWSFRHMKGFVQIRHAGASCFKCASVPEQFDRLATEPFSRFC